MSGHDHSGSGPRPTERFWSSRFGVALIVFLAVAGLLLAYEHRVHLLTGEGVLVALLALCVAMHFFMHGGHGGHGAGKNGPDQGDRS